MFSTSVKLIGINDFITPSKECTKPILVKDNKPTSLKSRIDATLSDCLACSGCVTSAETVFIQQQGLEELDKLLSDNLNKIDPKIIVFSISPQSFTSVMHKFRLNEIECIKKISNFLRNSLRVDYIFTTSIANQISIKESCVEFIKFYEANVRMSSHPSEHHLLVSGICPGWVCYAEKVQGDLMVPRLSTVRSSQAIMGSFVKEILCESIAKSHDQIFHVCIMPCFDRKLEAYRPDLSVKTNEEMIRQVDHVLSTYEFEDLLSRDMSLNQDFSLGFNSIEDLKIMESRIFVSRGNGSGGIAVNVFIYACFHLFDVKVDCQIDENGSNNWAVYSQGYSVKEIQHRSSDFVEWSLVDDATSEKLLTFSQIYGFKNIQNFINCYKKTVKMHQHFSVYAEIMACPGRGCLNGGGQSSSNEKTLFNAIDAKSHLKELEKIYRNFQGFSSDQIIDTSTEQTYLDLKTRGINLHREFYKLDKIVTNNSINW
ncbi:hypothetical protein MXB_4311 [Myxobolus squamalis]|nr:hypothetical protein MXB_4311 [Myxobolus squamalis]